DIDLLEAMFAYLAESGLSESIGALIPVVEAPPADADLIELVDAVPIYFSAARPLEVVGKYSNAGLVGGRLGVFISEDDEITADDLLVGSTPMFAKADGMSFMITVPRSRIPFLNSAEGYYIGVIADYEGITGDGDLTNNGNRLGTDLFYFVGTTRQEVKPA
ncbi:MAG: hypothetical protein RIT02_1181, partial [Planctomycetota bacterium]